MVSVNSAVNKMNTNTQPTNQPLTHDRPCTRKLKLMQLNERTEIIGMII